MVTKPKRRSRRTADPKSAEDKQNAQPLTKPGIRGGTYQPLSSDQISQIVDASYEILERTGIEVHESACLEVFRSAGCKIDPENNRVHLHASLIDEALASARSDVLLAGLDERHDLRLGGARVYLGTGGSAVNVLHLDGAVRPSKLLDNYDIGRLCDKLENIHFYMRPVVSRDLATEDIGVNSYYACQAATTKHIMSNEYVPENVWRVRELGNMIAGGEQSFDRRPIFSSALGFTVSPLRFAMETIEILDEVVKHGIPVALSTAPQAGATSPAALAGTLAQMAAEQLSGFVYVNLLRPGFPLLMGCVPAQADLRTGAFTGGSAEFALLHAATAQIAQYLKLPLYNSSGIADAKTPDAQAGFEKGLTTATAALAGSNYIHHSAGFLDSLMTVSYEQFVIDNDFNGSVMRMVRGIEVNEDTLSLDVIDSVCRGPKHFLGHEQTLELMNSEYFYPPTFNRKSRDEWQEAGAHEIRDAAREIAANVLDSHYPVIISPELDKDIRKRFPIQLAREDMSPGRNFSEIIA